MQYHKLNILIDDISADHDEFSYFLINEKRLVHLQEGVFRTNCIDCLDRTNVVQSMIAWRSLSKVLQVFFIVLKRLNDPWKSEIAHPFFFVSGIWPHWWEKRSKRRNKFLSNFSMCVGRSRRLHLNTVFRHGGVEDRLHENWQTKLLGKDARRVQLVTPIL